MKFTIEHTNINVTDLERSIKFYEEALSLHVVRRNKADDGSFELCFLTDEQGVYMLELTWLSAHPQPYELGDNEGHICFSTEDIEAAHAKHAEMGCICYENISMGLYFIHDPDDYWMEIVPTRK
jgi:lactoylglutathione lyase